MLLPLNTNRRGLSLDVPKRVKVIAWLNKYFIGKEWPLIPFQPILYLFIWAAAIRLWANPNSPPNFENTIVDGHDAADTFYAMWLAMGVFGPVLSLCSWIMITKMSGRVRFIGLWARSASDLMVFTNLLTFHVAAALTDGFAETRIFSRYLQGALVIFVFTLVVRDIWTLVLTERLAGRIHRDE